ncbi:MAG: YfcE family phosphodiesterase [Clostridia bacterium]
MKILVCSDLHCSVSASVKVAELVKKEEASRLVLCGDICDSRRDSVARSVADNLSSISGCKIVCAKGNNDYSGDCDFLPFVYQEWGVFNFDGRNVFFTHGHIYNESRLPPLCKAGDILCYGHTHRGKVELSNGVYVCNVGSLSLPRWGAPKSYAVIDESGIYLKTAPDEVIAQLLFS